MPVPVGRDPLPASLTLETLAVLTIAEMDEWLDAHGFEIERFEYIGNEFVAIVKTR